MKNKKPPTPTALAQRAFRQRMRDQGLVPQQIYIRAEHKELLSRIERALRLPALPPSLYTMESHAMSQQWNIPALHQALCESDFGKTGHASFHIHEGAEPTLLIEMHDLGDLPLHMVASGGEIRVSTTLCLASRVKDRHTFNEACLRLNPLYPLSNIGISQIDGDDTYIVFGQLSSMAPLPNVIEEIIVLGHNTIQAANELNSHLH
jgi:Uncharacterized protein conserved in bacteria